MLDDGPWLATMAAAIAVFALVAWRMRGPGRAARPEVRDAALTRVNGLFDAADTRALEARIAEAFHLVLAPRSPGGFAVIEHGDRYVQLGWGGGHTDVFLEAVSNAHLARDRRLGEDAQRVLAALGFTPPSARNDNHLHALTAREAGPDRLARLATRALTEALGAPLPGAFRLTTSIDG